MFWFYMFGLLLCFRWRLKWPKYNIVYICFLPRKSTIRSRVEFFSVGSQNFVAIDKKSTDIDFCTSDLTAIWHSNFLLTCIAAVWFMFFFYLIHPPHELHLQPQRYFFSHDVNAHFYIFLHFFINAHSAWTLPVLIQQRVIASSAIKHKFTPIEFQGLVGGHSCFWFCLMRKLRIWNSSRVTK